MSGLLVSKCHSQATLFLGIAQRASWREETQIYSVFKETSAAHVMVASGIFDRAIAAKTQGQGPR